MKELKLYLVDIHDDGTMKPKVYLFDRKVISENCQLIIVITYDECIFSTNNKVQKAWTQKRDMFFQPKRQDQGIMVWGLIFLFRRLNLASLTLEKK